MHAHEDCRKECDGQVNLKAVRTVSIHGTIEPREVTIGLFPYAPTTRAAPAEEFLATFFLTANHVPHRHVLLGCCSRAGHRPCSWGVGNNPIVLSGVL